MPWRPNNDVRFINPYNFVPLVQGVDRKPVEDWRGSLSGKISCSMTLKTPLAILDHEAAIEHVISPLNASKRRVHNEYPFMRVAGRPFIPGSELRGMTRAVFEAATNSCMSVFDNAPLNMRNKAFRQYGKPALLKKEGDTWYLYTAVNAYVLNTFSPVAGHTPYRIRNNAIAVHGQTYTNGSKVDFVVGARYFLNRQGHPVDTGMCFAECLGDGDQTGYLLLGEIGLSPWYHRHNSHIISMRDDTIRTALSPQTVQNLREVLACYRDDSVNQLTEPIEGRLPKHSGYAGYNVSETDYTPVFYRCIAFGHGAEAAQRFYLSPAMIGREVYYRTLEGIAGMHAPCTGDVNGEAKVCQACGVFGMIGDTSYGSAVRFTDARLDPAESVPNNAYHRITLKELAGPKVSAMEFYTSSSDGSYHYDNPRVHLRGRKFYIHHPHFAIQHALTNERTERNATAEVLLNEVTTANGVYLPVFHFDVFFDGLNEQTLTALMWCLSPREPTEKPQTVLNQAQINAFQKFLAQMGEAEQTQQAGASLTHKLGFGRPLGLGSVQIAIDHVETRTYAFNDNIGAYAITPMANVEDRLNAYAGSVPEALRLLLKFDLAGDTPVCYPLGNDGQNTANSHASHQWFSGNHQMNSHEDFVYSLPPVTRNGDLSLPKLQNRA